MPSNWSADPEYCIFESEESRYGYYVDIRQGLSGQIYILLMQVKKTKFGTIIPATTKLDPSSLRRIITTKKTNKQIVIPIQLVPDLLQKIAKRLEHQTGEVVDIDYANIKEIKEQKVEEQTDEDLSKFSEF